MKKITKKVNTANTKTKVDKKNENLRIPKNNEQKPEIKKIKKQETTKKE